MKSIKEKNGFTLIELLVTIVLILSILSIAIVSFVNISERQKQKALKKVEDQVVVAAKEFFSVNEYYKDNLINNNDYVTVSLGELVKNDYINAVTDPTTGKKLNECSYIKLFKDENSKLKYEFVKENNKCITNSFITIAQATNPGPFPNITYTIYGKKGNNDWYVLDGMSSNLNNESNSEIIEENVSSSDIESEDINTPIVKITAWDDKVQIAGDILMSTDPNNNESWVALETNIDSDGKLTAEDIASFSVSTPGKDVFYKVVNEIGNAATLKVSAKTDFDNPNCKISVSGTSDGKVTINKEQYDKYRYYTLLGRPSIKLSYSDNTSGVKTKQIKSPSGNYEDYSSLSLYIQNDTDENYVTWYGKITDKAGNQTICEKSMVVEDIKVLENIFNSIFNAIDKTTTKITCGETSGENSTWTNKNITIKQYYDENSLSKTQTNKYSNQITFSSTTKTSNITYEGVSCPVNVYVDKDAPQYSKIEFTSANAITLIQKDRSGNIIRQKSVPLTYTNGEYVGYTCLKRQDSTWNFDGYNYYVTEKGSGVKNFSGNRKIWSSNLGKWLDGECRNTKNQNPCIWYDIWYAYDNAGNKSSEFGKLKIYVGYDGLDSWCK